MNKTQKTFANDNLFAEINSRSLRVDLLDALVSLAHAAENSANVGPRLELQLQAAQRAITSEVTKRVLKACYMNLLVEFMAADAAALRAIARKSELAAEAEAYAPTAEEVAAAAKVERAAAEAAADKLSTCAACDGITCKHFGYGYSSTKVDAQGHALRQCNDEVLGCGAIGFSRAHLSRPACSCAPREADEAEGRRRRADVTARRRADVTAWKLDEAEERRAAAVTAWADARAALAAAERELREAAQAREDAQARVDELAQPAAQLESEALRIMGVGAAATPAEGALDALRAERRFESAIAHYRATSQDLARRQIDGGHYKALEAVACAYGATLAEAVCAEIQKDWIG